ncbi:MAG: hypothetical protein AB7T27_09765 [Kiritimatiellia bacterium]
MKISIRELMLAWLTMVVVVLALSWYAGMKKWDALQKAREQSSDIRTVMEHDQKLLDGRDELMRKMQELRSQLPSHPEKLDVTSELLRNLEQTANKSGLVLKTRSAGAETVSSNKLCEISIKCDWEGSLETLVPFLFDIQEQGVRYDIRELRVVPSKGEKEKLNGNFILDCAYSRQPAGNASEGL